MWVPDKFGYLMFGSGTRRVRFWSSPKKIGYSKWSGTRPQVQIPESIRYPSRLRISELIGYVMQLGHSMWSRTCCNFREILRMIDKVNKFRKSLSKKICKDFKGEVSGIKAVLSYSFSAAKSLKILVAWSHSSTRSYSSAQRQSIDCMRSNIRRRSSTRRRSSSRRHLGTRRY